VNRYAFTGPLMGSSRPGQECHFDVRLLPLPFAALVEVILLVCMSSPMYLRSLVVMNSNMRRGVALRLKEAVSAFEFLVFCFDRLDPFYNLEEGRLELLGLSILHVS
jgi:hypothetical protein